MEDLAREGRLASGPVVPALSRAFAAFLRQDFAAASAAIEAVLDQHERIGGSRAQRDLVEFTLLKAYERDAWMTCAACLGSGGKDPRGFRLGRYTDPASRGDRWSRQVEP